MGVQQPKVPRKASSSLSNTQARGLLRMLSIKKVKNLSKTRNKT